MSIVEQTIVANPNPPPPSQTLRDATRHEGTDRIGSTTKRAAAEKNTP